MDFQMPDTPILLSGEDYAYLSECFEPLSAAEKLFKKIKPLILQYLTNFFYIRIKCFI